MLQGHPIAPFNPHPVPLAEAGGGKPILHGLSLPGQGVNYSFEELWLRTLAKRLVDFFNID